MEVSSIIAEIDAQIAKLTEARRALVSVSTVSAPPTETKGRRGRPKGSKNASTVAKMEGGAAAAPRKRKLSPEGRKRIAEAMKARWAQRKNAEAN